MFAFHGIAVGEFKIDGEDSGLYCNLECSGPNIRAGQISLVRLTYRNSSCTTYGTVLVVWCMMDDDGCIMFHRIGA